jgi:hypothetical protein
MCLIALHIPLVVGVFFPPQISTDIFTTRHPWLCTKCLKCEKVLYGVASDQMWARRAFLDSIPRVPGKAAQ